MTEEIVAFVIYVLGLPLAVYWGWRLGKKYVGA